MVHHDRTRRSANAQQIQPRLQLGGEAEECGGSLTIAQEHSQFIKDLPAPEAAQLGALVGAGHHLDRAVIEKLRQLGDPVADDVVKQLAGQAAHPVVPVSEKRSDITGVAQTISEMAFQMDRLPAQEPGVHQAAQLQHFEGKLQIVPGGEPQSGSLRQPDKLLGLLPP